MSEYVWIDGSHILKWRYLEVDSVQLERKSAREQTELLPMHCGYDAAGY